MADGVMTAKGTRLFSSVSVDDVVAPLAMVSVDTRRFLAKFQLLDFFFKLSAECCFGGGLGGS